MSGSYELGSKLVVSPRFRDLVTCSSANNFVGEGISLAGWHLIDNVESPCDSADRDVTVVMLRCLVVEKQAGICQNNQMLGNM